MKKIEFVNRYFNNLNDYIRPGKVLIIFGPRQVGKTTLLEHYLASSQARYKFVSGDDVSVQAILSEPSLQNLQEYVAGYQLLVIDEAQKIHRIGETLKLMIDHMNHLNIIVTGSSSFELAGQIGEPLTGRQTTLTLYPIAQLELKQLYNKHELQERLENYLRFGCYPEVITANNEEEKKEIITEIAHAYLLKDILMLDSVKRPKQLLDLLRLLAFQIGKEVSLSELAQKLMIDVKTVSRYLDLLEKSFVIYNLRGFSRNLRNEMTKKGKYFFYDLGIRNALIANFNSLKLRDDVGELWENFLFIERIKKQSYLKILANNYFWRTWDQKEIDLIEERDGRLYGYEFKWGKKKVKAPKIWLETYKNASFEVISQDNYLEWIT